MKHFLRIFAFILAAAASSSGCKKQEYYKGDYLFKLVNESDEAIGWYIPQPNMTCEDGAFLPPEMPASLKNSYNHILPGDQYQFLSYEVPSEYLPDDAVRLYIFAAGTLAEYSWEQIREDNLYEHCFELTVNGLKDAGKCVVFEGE